MRSERGAALITTLMIMSLMGALLIGLTTVVMSDQRERLVDRDRSRAFYGAESGIETLTSGMATLFFINPSPTDAQIAGLGASPPVIPDVTFTSAGGGVAYGATYLSSSQGQITTGPWAGLTALKKTYQLDSSVRTTSGGESHLKRTIETVAIPVFQFGMFSDVDLSFHAGANFNFGGRVHTNGNLFLAEQSNTLTLSDKVTAVKEIVRQQLVNGVEITVSGHTSTVNVATAPNTYRSLAATEGSVVDGPLSAANPSWQTISLSTYNGYLRNGKTGVKPLTLPLVSSGGSNPDLIRRPVAGEDMSNPDLLKERLFTKASLRILLSDTAADITGLPGVTATAPVQLDGNWNAAPPAGYGPVDATHPPIARSPGPQAGLTVNGAVTAGANKAVKTNAAIIGYYKVPVTMTVAKAGQAGSPWTVTCTGTTPTTFTGCVPVVNPLATVTTAGAPTISGAVVTADGNVNVSQTLTANWASPWTTITVGNTVAFAPRTFWALNGNNTTVLVTCTGYDTTPQFTGCNVPAAIQNNAVISTAALSNAGTGTIGGFIKIEKQDNNNVWTDVTTEVLNYGIGGPNLGGAGCADPTPNAILRIQRLRDNGNAVGGACTYAGSTTSTDYWPNALFDVREALYRDVAPADRVRLGGVMYYVALDVRNVSLWFQGAGAYAGGSGGAALNNGGSGYAVYFSDRRNNRNAASLETGEYGFEDIVNPNNANGAPNGALDTGEDVNASGVLETYGQMPNYNAVYNTAPPGAAAPLDTTARPTTNLQDSYAQTNRAILFRHALKLVNGGLGNIVNPGLTVVAENPVYIQGDWNANGGFFDNDGHSETSVMADAVTLLTGNWSDDTSFADNGGAADAYDPTKRTRAANSYFRLAIIGGKNMPFPYPAAGAPPIDFGSDGGAHNFLRTLETGGTVNYRGSLATFFYSRQAVGVYKCCSTVYGAPTRGYNFDIDFLDIGKLPPLTPMFRDIDDLGFTEEIRPGR